MRASPVAFGMFACFAFVPLAFKCPGCCFAMQSLCCQIAMRARNDCKEKKTLPSGDSALETETRRDDLLGPALPRRRQSSRLLFLRLQSAPPKNLAQAGLTAMAIVAAVEHRHSMLELFLLSFSHYHFL